MNLTLFHQWLAAHPRSRRPLVVGVLNVTPDSFSDGGRYLNPAAAVERVRAMADGGADWIDCGAESTRPGADPVPADEQIRRLTPVFDAVAALGDRVIFSVDTTRAAVAEAALDAGFQVVNDVSAGRDDPGLLPLVSRRRKSLVLMHMQGTPRTMQAAPKYADVTNEVVAFLRERLAAAVEVGIDPARVVLDPGIGFGKTARHNLELLNRLDEVVAIGRPVLVGTSRKRFIGEVTGVDAPDQRTFGTAATVAWAVARGAAAVRVHDVTEMAQVVRMTAAILNPSVL